ncbi:MAG: glycosyltransferase [Candidatus Omnitrophota bacterium]
MNDRPSPEQSLSSVSNKDFFKIFNLMRIIHISTNKKHPCFRGTISLQSKRHDILFVVLDPCDQPRYNITSIYFRKNLMFAHLGVRKDFDFTPDPKLEAAFLKIFREFHPDVIHLQLFDGVNVLSILRAASQTPARKIITLHIHSLFCLSGACFDRGRVCRLNSIEECSCENCRSAAKREKLSLLKYNQIRLERGKEIISLTDTLVCCSYWQKETIRRLLGEESKTTLLYYGVRRFPKNKTKATVTKKEIAAAGMDWDHFLAIAEGKGWGTRMNGISFRFRKNPDSEMKKVRKAFGDDFKKLQMIVKKPTGKISKKNSLPSFGYLGSLWELKGVDVLLDALQRLGRLEFRVLMGISLMSDHDASKGLLKRMNQHRSIKILLNLKREEMYEKFFSQIDYLIIPSVWEETGPLTLFESFFHKVPVIISDRPGMVEKTRPGVNSFVFDNADSLAAIMRDIIEGRVTTGARTRANFPVTALTEYNAMIENIYSGKTIIE